MQRTVNSKNHYCNLHLVFGSLEQEQIVNNKIKHIGITCNCNSGARESH